MRRNVADGLRRDRLNRARFTYFVLAFGAGAYAP
jgi:hypothetical protein